MQPNGLFLFHLNALEDRPLRAKWRQPVREIEAHYILEETGLTMHFFSKKYLLELLADWREAVAALKDEKGTWLCNEPEGWRSRACHWGVYRERYIQELSNRSLAELTVQVLRVWNLELLPVLTCSEPWVDGFSALSLREKTTFGCHRFLLLNVFVEFAGRDCSASDDGIVVRPTHLEPSKNWRDL